jgi:antirestriction protein ArdC
VFNLHQCDGLPAEFSASREDTSARRIIPCEDIVSGYAGGPRIGHGYNSAYYSVAKDSVSMPAITAFHTPEDYYSTLLHELCHSTGHPQRLGRLSTADAPAPFGSPDYSREELVAEMGAALLCAEAGIACATLENQAAYIAGWLKELKGDARAVVVAAAQAQRAADHILGRSGETH